MFHFPERWLLAIWVTLAIGALTGAKLPEKHENPAEKEKTDLYGDPLPPDVLARLGTVRFHHGSTIRSIAFSPDGKKLASAGDNQSILLWDAATGKELLRLVTAEDSGIYSIAFSPDGMFLASGSWGHFGETPTIHLWEAATGKELPLWGSLNHGGTQIAFSPDGKVLACGDGKIIRLWDVAGRKELGQVPCHPDGSFPFTFSPDGKTLATADRDQIIRLREVATGKVLCQLPGHEKSGQMGSMSFSCHIVSLAFAPDGKTLASASTDRTTRLWDVATGKELRKWPEQRYLQRTCVAFSPDGKTLASGSQDGTCLWEPGTGKLLHRLGDRGGSESLAFSPDGRTLATGGFSNSVQLWQTETGKEISLSIGHQYSIGFAGFSCEGRVMISGSYDGDIRLWDPVTGQGLAQFQGPAKGFESAALSSDGKTLALGGHDGVISLYRMSTGKQQGRLKQGDRGVPCVAFSPDGKLLASASREKIIRIWEVVTGQELERLTGHETGVSLVTFSPDGKTLASVGGADINVGGGRIIRIWDVASGKEVRQCCRGQDQLIHQVGFSPDGKVLVTRTYQDPPRFWEATTGRELYRLQDDPAGLWSLAFSPDGKILALGGHNPTIRLREVATSKEINQFNDPRGGAEKVIFSPDGQVLASWSGDNSILVWDVHGLGREKRPRPTHLKPQELDALWADLAGSDIPQAYQAAWDMVAAADAVPFLQEHLRPTGDLDERIAQLIRRLDSDQFGVREESSHELQKIGRAAQPALLHALAAPESPEVGRRVERLLDTLENSDGPMISPDQLRAGRALWVLEQMNSLESRQSLETLARGAPDSWLTREAKVALDRLARRAIVSTK